jgi:uncharacterized protein (TIGR02118 family)
MARMVSVFKEPADKEAFEQHYFERHVPLAKQLPGLRKYEVSRGPILTPGGVSDAWLVSILHFDDMASMRSAFASEIGKACGADRRAFAPDSSTFQQFLFDEEEI